MKISAQMKTDLGRLAEKKVPVTINGFNEYGQPFTTTGTVLVVNGQPQVYDNGLILDFSNKQEEQTSRPNLSCQFIFDMENSSQFWGLLAIESMELPDGTKFYTNRSASKYMKWAQKNAKELEAKNAAEGRALDPIDPVSAEMQQFIGKPLFLDKSNLGILIHCVRCSNAGKSIAQICSSGSMMSTSFIDEDSKLLRKKEDGTFELITRNSASSNYDDRAEGKKPFTARASRIAELAAAKQQNS